MTKEQFFNKLTELILSLFSADEFRRFVRYSPKGTLLEKLLPGSNSSYMAIASDGVKILFENNAINDEFFDRLIDERPRRKSEIDRMRAEFHLWNEDWNKA